MKKYLLLPLLTTSIISPLIAFSCNNNAEKNKIEPSTPDNKKIDDSASAKTNENNNKTETNDQVEINTKEENTTEPKTINETSEIENKENVSNNQISEETNASNQNNSNNNSNENKVTNNDNNNNVNENSNTSSELNKENKVIDNNDGEGDNNTNSSSNNVDNSNNETVDDSSVSNKPEPKNEENSTTSNQSNQENENNSNNEEENIDNSANEETEEETQIQRVRKNIVVSLDSFMNREYEYLAQRQDFLNFKKEWLKTNVLENEAIESKVSQKPEFYKEILFDFYINLLKDQLEFWSTPDHLWIEMEEEIKGYIKFLEYKNLSKYFVLQWGVDNNNKWSLSPTKFLANNFFRAYKEDENHPTFEDFDTLINTYNEWKWVKTTPDSNVDRYKNQTYNRLITTNTKNFADALDAQENFLLIGETAANYYLTLNENDFVNLLNDPEPDMEAYEAKETVRLFDPYLNVDWLSKAQNEFFVKYLKNNGSAYDNFLGENEHTVARNKTLYWDSFFGDIDFNKYIKYNPTTKTNEYTISGNPSDLLNALVYEKSNIYSSFANQFIYELIQTTDSVTNKQTDDPAFSDRKYSWITPVLYNNDPDSPKLLNPFPKYLEWRNHWAEILTKIINPSWTDEQKIKAVSFYILKNVSYNYTGQGFFGDSQQYSYDGYGFYSPFAIFGRDRTMQCVGYSKNFSMAMTLLGIPVRMVGGSILDEDKRAQSGEHEWNEVYIDGRWKVVDLTWADKDYAHGDFTLTLNNEYLLSERSSDVWSDRRLELNSYLLTIFKFKNQARYEYEGLPTYFTKNQENQPTWQEWINSNRHMDFEMPKEETE